MAPKKGEKTIQITLVGQSDSGKTNLLATVLGNIAAHTDLGTGHQRVEDVSWTAASGESYDDQNMDKLLSYATNILRGRKFDNPGTDEVKIYPCTLRYKPVHVSTTRRNVVSRMLRGDNGPQIQERVGETQEIKFNIVDGRGGDIAPERYLDPNDPNDAAAIARQDEYRQRLNDSHGAVVIMPIDKHGFKMDMAQRLVAELMRTIEVRNGKSDLPPLEHIALCYTKYDELFVEDGATAGERAGDVNRALEHLKDEAIVKVFEPIISLADNDPKLTVMIFPVSTFGFVGGDGVANFYNWKHSPGLLARAVGPKDWKNPKLDVKNHFPFEITENEANTLWRPFNIAPPLFFALTGRITGPLCLHPDELLSAPAG